MRMYKSFLVGACLVISIPILGVSWEGRASETENIAIENFNKDVAAIKAENAYDKLGEILRLAGGKYDCDFDYYPNFKEVVRKQLAEILKTKEAEQYLAKSTGKARTGLYLLGRDHKLSDPLIGALIDAGRFDDKYPYWDAVAYHDYFFTFCDVVFALGDEKRTKVIDKIAENRKDFFDNLYECGSGDQYTVDSDTKKCLKILRVYGGNRYPFLHALIYWVEARDKEISADKKGYTDFVMYLARKAIETSPEIVFAKHYAEGTVTEVLSRALQKAILGEATKNILRDLQSEIQKSVSITMLARSLHALLN